MVVAERVEARVVATEGPRPLPRVTSDVRVLSEGVGMSLLTPFLEQVSTLQPPGPTLCSFGDGKEWGRGVDRRSPCPSVNT